MKSKRILQSWWLNPVLAIASVAMFLAVSELVIRAFGFEHSRIPKMMQSNFVDGYVDWQNENKPLQHFDLHPTRFWAGVPNVGNINAIGYQGPVLPIEKTAGSFRILFLGDSCTNTGDQHYPSKTVGLLEEQLGIEAESLIAAIGGYSTLQGLRFLEESRKYRPDLIVAYFGWNDHWLASAGRADNELDSISPLDRLVFDTVGKLRLFQLMSFLAYPSQRVEAKGPVNLKNVVSHLRVPPEYFQENIRSMASIASELGAPILFISPPMGPHIVDAKLDYLFPTKQIPLIHGYYRKLLRDTVGPLEGAQVVTYSDIVFDRSLMAKDGIHPTPAGYSVIAERLAEVIARCRSTSGCSG